MFEEGNEEKDIHTEEGGERTEVDKWDTKEDRERNIEQERERNIEQERERNTDNERELNTEEEKEDIKETGSMDSMNRIFSLLQGFAFQDDRTKLFPIILKAGY